jgi:hypothetical protein
VSVRRRLQSMTNVRRRKAHDHCDDLTPATAGAVPDGIQAGRPPQNPSAERAVEIRTPRQGKVYIASGDGVDIYLTSAQRAATRSPSHSRSARSALFASNSSSSTMRSMSACWILTFASSRSRVADALAFAGVALPSIACIESFSAEESTPPTSCSSTCEREGGTGDPFGVSNGRRGGQGCNRRSTLLVARSVRDL